MILVDTSVWIEFLKGQKPVLDSLSQLLEQQEVLGAEWIFGELLQGALSEKEIKVIKAYWDNIQHIDPHNIWIAAGELSQKLGLFSKGVGLIDAAIIAAARKHKARIWTLDKKLNKILMPHEILTS